MIKEDIKLGVRVVRSKGDYVVGRTGEIVGNDPDKQRVQVQWGGMMTWVSYKVVELESVPYELVSVPGKHGGTYSKYKAL